jgi:hypothetical protein
MTGGAHEAHVPEHRAGELVVATLLRSFQGQTVGLPGAVGRAQVEEQDPATEQCHEPQLAGQPVPSRPGRRPPEELLGQANVLVDGAEERGRVDAVVQRPVPLPSTSTCSSRPQ